VRLRLVALLRAIAVVAIASSSIACSGSGTGSATPAGGATPSLIAGADQTMQPAVPSDAATTPPAPVESSPPSLPSATPSPSAATRGPATTTGPVAPGSTKGTVQLAAAPLAILMTNGEPLPPCAYAGIPTSITGQSDFGMTLMDTTYGVTAAYTPAGLVQATASGIRSRELVRSIIIPDLKRMAAAASAAGASLAIVSAYRSYQNQTVTFRHWVNIQGYARALTASARPGHSEHQLGTAIDFKSRAGPLPWLMKDWAKQSAAGVWLAANAWKYGFIMSYPRGQIASTCYEYEPWHYRYVGVAEAATVHASGLVLRQWIWEHQPNPEPPSP
jgi:zinc D-Ala-D-Ala carboxypeptidase